MSIACSSPITHPSTQQVFQRMEAAEKRQNAMRIPGFLSTHPAFPDRIAQLRVKVNLWIVYVCLCVVVLGVWSRLLRILQLAVAQCSSKGINATTGGAGALRVRGRPHRQRRVGVGRRGCGLIDRWSRDVCVCVRAWSGDGRKEKESRSHVQHVDQRAGLCSLKCLPRSSLRGGRDGFLCSVSHLYAVESGRLPTY